jgi:drug/metabolite transporter (DMT)-like permease
MKLKYYALPIGVVVIWSFNPIVAKLSARVIDPAAMVFYRWLIAGVFMAPFLVRPAWQQRQAILKTLPKLAVLGLLGMVFFQDLAYIAAKTTSVTNMGLIVTLMPLFAMGFSVSLLGEKVSRGDLAGSILSIAGLVYLFSEGTPTRLLTHGVTPGDGLMLLAVLAYSAYGVLLKRWQLPFTRWVSLFVQVWCAVVVSLIYYLLHGAPEFSLSVFNLSLVLFAALPASILAPILWIAAVQHFGATRATATMNLVPIVTVAIAVFFLGEPLHAYHLWGGGAALLGVILAQRWTCPLLNRSTSVSNACAPNVR